MGKGEGKSGETMHCLRCTFSAVLFTDVLWCYGGAHPVLSAVLSCALVEVWDWTVLYCAVMYYAVPVLYNTVRSCAVLCCALLYCAL